MSNASRFRWLDPWRRSAEPPWIGPLVAGITLVLVVLAIFTDPGKYETGPTTLLANIGFCLYALVMVAETGGWHLPQPLFLLCTCGPIAFGAFVGRDTIILLLALVVVWWVTYTQSSRQGRIALYCGLASIMPPFLTDRGTIDNFFAWSLSLVMVWVSTYAIVAQQHTLAELRLAQAHLARQAAVDERRRLAREVHDVVAHSLAITLLHVTGARHILARDPQRAATALAQAETLGRASMADLRRTIGLLTTDENSLSAPPSAADIPVLLNSYVQAGLALDSTINGNLDHVPASAGLDLYRVIQEALTNVVKHSGGSAASLRLTVDEHAAQVEITNALPTSSTGTVVAETGTGRGLLGMRERVTSYGGRFSAAREGDGWRVHIWLPFAPLDTPVDPLSEKVAQPL